MQTNAKTRIAEKQRLEKTRVLNPDGWQSLFTTSSSAELKLSLKYYVYVFMIDQFSIRSNQRFFNIMMTYGGVLCLAFDLLLMVILTMPLFVLFTFMGVYNKEGMIKFWDCIPVLKGMGYAIALWSISQQLLNISYGSISLLLIPDLFREKLPWENCDFPGATNNCIPMYHDRNTLKTNCSSNSFSVREYLRYNKRKTIDGIDELGSLNVDWAVCQFLSWILIFLSMILGLKRVYKGFCKLHFVLIAALLPLLFYIVVMNKSNARNVVYMGLSPLEQPHFWASLFTYNIDCIVPGTIVYMAALQPEKHTPYITSLITFIAKQAYIFLIIIWESNMISIIMQNYNLQKKCLQLTGIELIYAVVPEVLTRLVLARLWIFLWFLHVYTEGLFPAVFTFAAILDSFAIQYEFVHKHRIRLCIGFCLIGSLLNLVFITSANELVAFTWFTNGMELDRVITMFIIITAIPCIYTIKRVTVDYAFKYKEEPNNYLTVLWRTSPYIAVLGIMIILSDINFQDVNKIPEGFYYISIAIGILFLLPLFSVMLYLYCKYLKIQKLEALVKPSLHWGCHNKHVRAKRQEFDPSREIGYKMEAIACKHNCLMVSPKYLLEKKNQTRKRETLMMSLNEHT